MTRKKNGFWTFVFSLLPGAGEMYMGFMKQGITLMGAFFLLIFLASWLNMGPLLFVLPVLWCYSFFHVHNLRGLSDEEFYAIEDDYLFHLDRVMPKNMNMDKKSKNLLALILIVIGAAMLWKNLNALIRWILPSYLRDWYWTMADMLPQIIVAGLLIAGGIWLIRGKKKELDGQMEDEASEKQKEGEQP